MKRFLGPAAFLAAVVVAVMAMAPALVDDGASASGCDGPASYSWKGTAIPYGIRTYSVEYCGPDSLDAYAGADWKGNKNISLAFVAPDGTIHYFYGDRHIDGEVEGPLADGSWTLVVRNSGSSNVSFTAAVGFE